MGESARDTVDPTFYPVREKVGEELLQRLIMEVLRPAVEEWLRGSEAVALVGADQFIYWEQYNARKAVSPDVYVLPGVPPETPVTAWKVWETGIVPSFAFEVVSGSRLKDYEEAPKRYAELGVEELVLFDPHSEASRSRVRWQVLRRDGGELLLVERSDGDRVRSNVLGCWLRQVGTGTATRVRVGFDPDGHRLLPTAGERAESEAERAESEAERAESEAERADAAEAEVRRLRAELEQLRTRR